MSLKPASGVVATYAGWLIPAAIAAYLGIATWTQRVASDGPPFPVALIALSAIVLGVAATRTRLGPVLVSAVIVCSACALTDVGFARSIRFTDLGIYLTAGRHLLDGQPVYQTTPLTSMPADYTALPYLYPPPTVVLFAALAALPGNLGGVLFVAGSVAIAFAGLRRIGLSLAWSLAFLLWPPMFDGIMSGNVSVALFGLFALAPVLGAGLVISPMFKPYTAIQALWLVRERRWAAAIIGGLVVVAVCVLTLPLVGGLTAWSEWIAALGAFAQSEQAVRQLRGIALERYALPAAAVLIAAIVLTVVALRRRGGPSLAGLGVATIVAQPTLYLHGFSVAAPAMLALRSAWLWLAAAPLAVVGPPILRGRFEWPGPWLALALIVASWAVPALRRVRSVADDGFHPLGPTAEPWPDLAEPVVTRATDPNPLAFEPTPAHRENP
jgi:glycosyl transferase family 87